MGNPNKPVEPLRLFGYPLTLEPAIFFLWFFTGLSLGGEQKQNIIMTHICRYELGYNETICANRSAYEDAQTTVQTATNLFVLQKNYITTIPGIAYALIAGSLSDDFGRKPLVMLPALGVVLEAFLTLVGYYFMHRLPLYYWYFAEGFRLLGGMPLYYLGVYSYGTCVTSVDERATRLSLYDGVEQLSLLVSVAISPTLLKAAGYSGTHYSTMFGGVCALIYLYFFLPELPRKESSKESGISSIKSPLEKMIFFVKRFLMQPIVDMIKALSAKRGKNLRLLLFCTISTHLLYLFTYAGYKLQYLYMLRHFKNFTGDDYAYYNVYETLIGLVGLIVVVPLLTGKLKWHESQLLPILCLLAAASDLLTLFQNELIPDFYLARSLSFMNITIYSLNRTLITRCISTEEVGRIFATISIFAALLPFLAQSAYRGLYHVTLKDFPGAYMLLSMAILILAASIHSFVFTQRQNMLTSTNPQQEERNETEMSDVKSS